jgi:hypothetical protein
MVFCGPKIKPYGVWTGSFNMTANAGMSLENAVYLKNDRIARSYFAEWKALRTISEPTDW